MSADETGLVFGEHEVEPELSPQERALRDRFVDEYMVDYSPYAACLRVGYAAGYAMSYAQKFMEESYVRVRIAQKQAASAADQKGEDETTRRTIRQRLIAEANYHGPGSSHAARVSALAKLTAIYGMDAPTVTKNEHIHKGGVMRIPAVASIDEWEKAARDSQDKLVSDVRH